MIGANSIFSDSVILHPIRALSIDMRETGRDGLCGPQKAASRSTDAGDRQNSSPHMPPLCVNILCNHIQHSPHVQRYYHFPRLPRDLPQHIFYSERIASVVDERAHDEGVSLRRYQRCNTRQRVRVGLEPLLNGTVQKASDGIMRTRRQQRF